MHSQLSNDNGTTMAEDIWLSKLPPGYKFCPNDAELINYYLKQKLAGVLIIPPRIHDVDVYKYPPDELEKTYKFKGENEMYFFTPRSKKYKEGQRPDRDVENHGFQYGFWKATGKENQVTNNDDEIGLKRTLVYHRGKQGKSKKDKPNEPAVAANWKTNWIMQEFRIKDLTSSSATLHNMDDWALCKIYESQYGMKKNQIIGQNNKRLRISTNVFVNPQCQPSQYHQTQCMQPSLSPNMAANSQCHFNQNSSLAQEMQDAALLTSIIMGARYQANQHSQSRAMKVSSSQYMIDISQRQSNQHSNRFQQMQASLSGNMASAPQGLPNQHSQSQGMKVSSSSYMIDISRRQSNQHYDQFQQRQASLLENMVVASQDHPNQHSLSQPMKALSSPYTIGISQCQSSQHYTQAQQEQASSPPDMVSMPQQMQDCLPADMFDVPQDEPNKHSHSQMEDDSDTCDFLNFDPDINNNLEYFQFF